MKRFEGICWVLIAVGAFAAVCYAFWSRSRNDGGTPLVQEGRVLVVGTSGQPLSCSTITFVDSAGKHTMSIHAGPPPTMELTVNGRVKVLDLQKLAARATLFGDQE